MSQLSNGVDIQFIIFKKIYILTTCTSYSYELVYFLSTERLLKFLLGATSTPTLLARVVCICIVDLDCKLKSSIYHTITASRVCDDVTRKMTQHDIITKY